MKRKLYVGIKIANQTRTVFAADSEPTEKTHGALYNAVVGPFRTRRGAEFMARYGGNNPHLLCVNDAERISKNDAAPRVGQVLSERLINAAEAGSKPRLQ